MSDGYNLRGYIEGLEKQRLLERIAELETEVKEQDTRMSELSNIIEACIGYIDSADPDRLKYFLPDFVEPGSWAAVLPGKIEQLMRDANRKNGDNTHEHD